MAKKATRTVARKTARGRRARRANPLIPFTRADLQSIHDYVTPASMQKIKAWKMAGKGVPEEGTPVLRSLAKELMQRGPGLTGMYRVSAADMKNLEYFIRRHPDRLSEAAKRRYASLLKGRMSQGWRRGGTARPREWWNVIARSGNEKLGGFAATYGPVETCPGSCAMRGRKPGEVDCDSPAARACYGGEHNTLNQWTWMQRGYAGMPWKTFLRKLSRVPAETIRVNVIGDLPPDPSDPSKMRLDAKRVMELARAASIIRRVKRPDGTRRWVRPNAFTYTHYLPWEGNNDKIVQAARKAGLQVNWSADNLDDADRKARYGDVAVVIPRAVYVDKRGRKRAVTQITTPEGRPIFFCPEILSGDKANEETRVEADRLSKELGRKLTPKEKAAIKEGMVDKFGKTCSTCSTPKAGDGRAAPACAWRNRKQIIGFLAHGQQGAAKHLTEEKVRQLLSSPTLRPLSRAQIMEAAEKGARARAAEWKRQRRESLRAIEEVPSGMSHEAVVARLAAIEKAKTGRRPLAVVPNPRRRNSTATRQSLARARAERLARIAALTPAHTLLSHWRRR